MTTLGQEGNSRDHQQLSSYYNQYDKKENGRWHMENNDNVESDTKRPENLNKYFISFNCNKK